MLILFALVLLVLVSQVSCSLRPKILPKKSIRLGRLIDGGKFSSVFEGYHFDGDKVQRVAVKVYKDCVNQKKIEREIAVLMTISGSDRSVRCGQCVGKCCSLIGVCKHDDGINNDDNNNDNDEEEEEKRIHCLVLEHACEDNKGQVLQYFSLSSPNLNDIDSAENPLPPLSPHQLGPPLYVLLKMLGNMHERHNIMHRDIKPRNVLLLRDRYTGDIIGLRLVDFGLGEWSGSKRGDRKLSYRVCTKSYKSPELILGSMGEQRMARKDKSNDKNNGAEIYGFGVDIWGVGCILGGILLGREPLFPGKDVARVRKNIEKMLGPISVSKRRRGLTLKEEKSQFPHIDDDAGLLNLLVGLLKVDASERLTAFEACEYLNM